MSNDNYNGWSNYATWRVNIEVFDSFMDDNLEVLEQYKEDKYGLVKYLKDYVDGILSQDGQSLAYDYASAFVSEVNYYEIAEKLLEEYESFVADLPF